MTKRTSPEVFIPMKNIRAALTAVRRNVLSAEAAEKSAVMTALTRWSATGAAPAEPQPAATRKWMFPAAAFKRISLFFFRRFVII